MLTPRTYAAKDFKDIAKSSRGYALAEVRLDIPDSTHAIFKARLNGPPGQTVWARAWLSTEAGTLAETASPPMKAGDEATLSVTLSGLESPQYAYMRIESAPLQTEHVVALKLS